MQKVLCRSCGSLHNERQGSTCFECEETYCGSSKSNCLGVCRCDIDGTRELPNKKYFTDFGETEQEAEQSVREYEVAVAAYRGRIAQIRLFELSLATA